MIASALGVAESYQRFWITFLSPPTRATTAVSGRSSGNQQRIRTATSWSKGWATLQMSWRRAWLEAHVERRADQRHERAARLPLSSRERTRCRTLGWPGSSRRQYNSEVVQPAKSIQGAGLGRAANCRDVAPIGELSKEHERIGEIASRLRRDVLAGDGVAAVAVLGELQTALAPHLERESSGCSLHSGHAGLGRRWPGSRNLPLNSPYRAPPTGFEPVLPP